MVEIAREQGVEEKSLAWYLLTDVEGVQRARE